MIRIELPDGSAKEYPKGVSGYEIAESIGERLAKAAFAIEVDGSIKDLHAPIDSDARIRIITYRDDEGKEIFKHSASHIMADAVLKVFPKAKLTIGPAIKDGFYYDFDIDRPFSESDIAKIEKEMDKIVAADHKFIRLEPKTKAEAKAHLKKHHPDNEYKLELMDELGDDKASFYQHDKFVDLCRGPHLPSTGKVKAFKLTKIAGAYWRGDAKNKQLQRIYGVAFPDKKELDQYLHLLREAEKRDHRKIGKELELFSIHDEGPGFPFMLPKGVVLKEELIKYWKELHRKKNYELIETPILLNRKLWETSKHWFNYKENMYTLKIDNEDFAVKPMNCPGGMLVYNEKVHSYKEFPLRVGELGIVHRHELSGTLSGLFRVRVFTQDDAHHFMTEAQMKSEVNFLIDLYKEVYGKFGFDYKVELSTRPEKSIGTDEQWEFLTNTLREVMEDRGMEFKINEGDGAFYGPKIDFHLSDCLGRTWQCGTIQLDMAQPENFDLTYMGEDGTRNHRPVMLHRVVYGSIERFMGILIEHFAGKFPLWLSPVQVILMTVANRFDSYADKIYDKFFEAGIRVERDYRAESIGKKVREAQLQKIPIMLTIGEKEEKYGTVAVRTLDGQIKFGVKPDDLLKLMKKNVESRDLNFRI
ncbi:threonine--tRNA ligase [Candidatus Woesearchaeota archaeon]|nr:threonine--tRNA ligase [Candidatus Woesearchaeota archaeon]